MLKLNGFSLTLILIISALNPGCAFTRGICTDQSDEISVSPYWQTNTESLVTAIKTGANADREIESRVPTLAAMVRTDATNQKIFGFWGTSINFDEKAKAEIINPEITAAIGRLAGQPMGARYVHAGLAHTYGYLLSNLVTPYGYKRERWTLPTIDDGFGWLRGPVSPAPDKGTLLVNVTFLAGKIAFRDDKSRLDQLSASGAGAAPEIASLNTGTLSIRRLTETVQLAGSAKSGSASRTVTLITDLVKLPFASKDPKALTYILVYSITDTEVAGRRLITLFPMTEAAADAVFTPANLGYEKPVVTRYNAYVPGLTGTAINGSRLATH